MCPFDLSRPWVPCPLRTFSFSGRVARVLISTYGPHAPPSDGLPREPRFRRSSIPSTLSRRATSLQFLPSFLLLDVISAVGFRANELPLLHKSFLLPFPPLSLIGRYALSPASLPSPSPISLVSSIYPASGGNLWKSGDRFSFFRPSSSNRLDF